MLTGVQSASTIFMVQGLPWSSNFLTLCLIKPLMIPCLPPFPTNFYNGLLCSHKLNISPVLQHVVPRFDYKHRRTSSSFGPAVSFISCSPALHLEEAGSCTPSVGSVFVSCLLAPQLSVFNYLSSVWNPFPASDHPSYPSQYLL